MQHASCRKALRRILAQPDTCSIYISAAFYLLLVTVRCSWPLYFLFRRTSWRNGEIQDHQRRPGRNLQGVGWVLRVSVFHRIVANADAAVETRTRNCQFLFSCPLFKQCRIPAGDTKINKFTVRTIWKIENSPSHYLISNIYSSLKPLMKFIFCLNWIDGLNSLRIFVISKEISNVLHTAYALQVTVKTTAYIFSNTDSF